MGEAKNPPTNSIVDDSMPPPIRPRRSAESTFPSRGRKKTGYMSDVSHPNRDRSPHGGGEPSGFGAPTKEEPGWVSRVNHLCFSRC